MEDIRQFIGYLGKKEGFADWQIKQAQQRGQVSTFDILLDEYTATTLWHIDPYQTGWIYSGPEKDDRYGLALH